MLFRQEIRGPGQRRRGVTAVIVVVSLTTMFAFAALTVDVGMLYNTRNELQRSADSAARLTYRKYLARDERSVSPM